MDGEPWSRANYLTVAQTDLLNDWGRTLAAMFNGDHAMHVGSSLERADWRDVDVRMVVLDDDKHAALKAAVNIARLNLVVSLWGQQVTGLPIDFQVQDSVENAEYHSRRRNALGISQRGWPADGPSVDAS